MKKVKSKALVASAGDEIVEAQSSPNPTPKPAPVLPEGFEAVVSTLIAAKNAVKPPKRGRRGLLSDVLRDVQLGKAPPQLEFNSAVNYTYNRHAERLYELWKARDVSGLAAYQMKGKNTYARALARYRQVLINHLCDKAALEHEAKTNAV